ncbi:flagellar basal-body MS-ring/collar protein FliF [Hyphomonas sp.]|jgi:flagellar M-ring protein FliF|uniref:flagellar basal-body MS-ring/collar protein FliF n=1 Tax=Hyphomonas sp. TaxID=87 RepID=UPI000A432B6E|nr:flagellar basal-body MS-ring/collar protein FliF [Hyphomonas sp.]MBA4339181.1 flagellar M-ring protein FliF [Hyphomonas sp.]
MKFIETLRALPLSRQLLLGAAVLGIVFAMSFMVQGATKEPMALLYSGLEPQYAGEIIEELEQSGVEYEIQGGAIFIPEGKRDSVRFALAKEGLPRQSVQGYELLDEVNGFSVTSEMYNASYWRAKEGELTRTILAIPGISAARVHIGASLRSGFARSQPAQTASVTLTTTHSLSKGQAEAIQYLVALAVSGLKPEDVAVIDPTKGILAGPNSDETAEAGPAAEDQASALEQKITSLLEARVGAGNARVSVSVDVSRERQRVSTVAFDPQSKVIRSRTTSDMSESGSGGGGALTVASNLPQEGEGAAAGGSTNASKNSSENIAYEINETRTEIEKLPGQIERISIAVLLNEQSLGLDPAAADAATVRDKVLADLQSLVTSGAGLNLERGDSISVELMPFQQVTADDLVAAPGMMQQLLERYLWSGLQALLLGLVVIVLAFGVVRPMLSPKKADVALDGTAAPGAAPAFAGGAPESDPLNYLKDYAREREEETAALLQQWLNEDQKIAVNE